MSEIIQFQFGFNDIRVVLIENEPWLVAKDVCEVLGIKNDTDACGRLDDDEKDAVGIADSIGRNQQMTVISESGFYRLVMTSRKPEVKKFQKWITSEVIPSIRKTGSYSVDHQPQLPPYIENVQIAHSLTDINESLSWNPRLAQFLIDQTIDRCFGQKSLSYGELPIKGVAEIAESMGLPINHKNRSALGRYIASLGTHEQLKEDRLCNGQIRQINCYRVTDSIKSDISAFFS